MPLAELALPAGGPASRTINSLIREADYRAGPILAGGRVPAFVPCDYLAAYGVLAALAEAGLARGPVFCEWGSGIGTVTGLAALCGFDACGIEAAGELVDQARSLAEDFGLAVEFAHGSFVPPGGEPLVHRGGQYAWLTTEADGAYEELGLWPADLDVVFAYPWPDEEAVTAALFDRYAGPGAVLITCHEGGSSGSGGTPGPGLGDGRVGTFRQSVDEPRLCIARSPRTPTARRVYLCPAGFVC